jgi:hypothetical protein
MRKSTWAGLVASAIAISAGGTVFAAGAHPASRVDGVVEGSYQAEDKSRQLALIVFGAKLSRTKTVALAKPGFAKPIATGTFTFATTVDRSQNVLVAEFPAGIAPGTYDVFLNVPDAFDPTEDYVPAGQVHITSFPATGSVGSLGAAGVINTTGNPIDWTQLKNVPAGFADGTDAVTTLAGSGVATTASHSDHNHDTSYVLKSGDTVSGPLTVAGALTANSATATSDNALIARCSVATASTTAANNCAIFKNAAGSNVARVDNTGKGWFNGGTAVAGADFAESVEVKGAVAEFEAGDVIVIDTGSARRFGLSATPGSALVAGVYATKPGVVARPTDVAGDLSWMSREIPMAMVGIVPTKVCDEGGAIRIGDLLVTSSVRGRAMKAPANPAPGTILGKALGALDGKSGRIEVLLQAR